MLSGIQRLTPFLSQRFPIPKQRQPVPDLRPPLQALYRNYNGGFYWRRALLVRPTHAVEGAPRTVSEWNDGELWKNRYEDLCKDVTFFAEDAFGMQFGVDAGRVVQFDPEAGEFTAVADTIDGWCKELLADPEFHTGSPALRAWERENAQIQVGFRLLPKKFFIFGGDFEPSNMVSKSDVDGMLIRADIWKQTKDLPDGQQFVFRVKD